MPVAVAGYWREPNERRNFSREHPTKSDSREMPEVEDLAEDFSKVHRADV